MGPVSLVTWKSFDMTVSGSGSYLDLTTMAWSSQKQLLPYSTRSGRSLWWTIYRLFPGH